MAEPDSGAALTGFGVLNRRPLIIHLIWAADSPFSFIEELSVGLGAEPALVLVMNYWSVLARSRFAPELFGWSFDCYARDYRLHRQRCPQHQVVLLANDATEYQFAQARGVDTVLFQQNGFLHAYDLPPAAEKEFAAVYIARIEAYKRFELAEEIASCCVVFASANREYYNSIRERIAHFTFANGDPASSLSDNVFLTQTPRLSRDQVGQWCARSRTGLCLSAEEGAMFASAEYMLWGLPIVSTRSIGGRDEYFDDRFCLICDDDAASVAAAVKRAMALDVDPRLIRGTFLAKVMARRTILLEVITSRLAAWEGSLEPFMREWLNAATPFYDRMRSTTVPQLLAEL